MKFCNEVNQAIEAKYNMLLSIFGISNPENIRDKITKCNFKAINEEYIKSVFSSICRFPITLGNTMTLLPCIEYDVDWLSEIYCEGYISGIIRRIISFCESNHINYLYKDEILFVGDTVIACNKELFYNVFEIENIINKYMYIKNVIIEEENKQYGKIRTFSK